MKCIICDKEAVGRITVDLDINGIGFCKDHEEDVKLASWILLYENEEEYHKYIESVKKQYKNAK